MSGMYHIRFTTKFEEGHNLYPLTHNSCIKFVSKKSAIEWIKNTHNLTIPDYPSGKPKTITVTEFYFQSPNQPSRLELSIPC